MTVIGEAREHLFFSSGPFKPYYYDLSVWTECSLATALERTIDRAQEERSPEETVRAYRTLYFPAEEIHCECNDPKNAATLTMTRTRFMHRVHDN